MSQTIASSAPPPRQCPCTAGERHFLAADQSANHGVELEQHRLRLCQECAPPHRLPPKKPCLRHSAQLQKHPNALDFSQRLRQFLHHRNVDDVQRWIVREQFAPREGRRQLSSRASLDSTAVVIVIVSASESPWRRGSRYRLIADFLNFADARQRIARTGLSLQSISSRCQ